MVRAPRRLAICLLVALAGFDLLQILAALRVPGRQDFFGLWSFARFIHENQAAGLYDPVGLGLYQHRLAPDFTTFYPFAYPPDMLLPLWPFGALPYREAWVVWLGMSAALFAMACWSLLRGSRRWRGFGMALVLLAPASLMNAITGETGYFAAALLAGGFALLPARPVLAGLLFGLLSLKPQIAVLLPFALAGVGAWRSLFAATVSALALALLSCVAFSPQLWLVWAHALPVYQGLVGQNARLYGLMTNISALPLSLGAGPLFSESLQLAASAMLAGGCYAAFRWGSYRLAVAALLAGTQAAAMHVLVYDAAAASLVPLLLLEQYGPRLTVAELLLGGAALAAPFFADGGVGPANLAGLVYAGVSLRLAWLACRGA